jgi:subtilisin family serine protease
MDVYGHGTHVAGTACAEDNGNGDLDGPYGVVGVAPACALYALRVLDDNGFGDASDLIAAMEWAVDNGIQVANLSLGWDLNPGDTVKAAFDNAEAAGLVIVAAACNNGNRPGKGDNVCYPALYDSVIAVAATDASDRRASFSSTGDQVELAAPGVSVFSTWNDDTGYYDPQPVCREEEGVKACYKYGSGTSMASPHVAGTAALILAASPGWTNDQVREQLQATADDLGTAGWDPLYGFGLVNAAEAAAGPANAPPSVSITSPSDGASFESGATITFEGTAVDAEDGDLAVGLAWVSSIDEVLGTGGSIPAVLSNGHHIITASVTDSDGSTASDSVTVMVGSGDGTMYVFAIDMSGMRAGPNRSVIAVVTIKDTDGNLVAGATVHGTWSGDYSGSVSGVTGTDGAVRFESGKVRHAATFTFTVDDVDKSGYTYDSGLNPEDSATFYVP